MGQWAVSDTSEQTGRAGKTEAQRAKRQRKAANGRRRAAATSPKETLARLAGPKAADDRRIRDCGDDDR
jgi:hypothetical protein